MIEYRDSLLQEELMAEDPTGWRMLVGCILLNRTSRRAVELVRDALFHELHDPGDGFILYASTPHNGPLYRNVRSILEPLGLVNVRISAIGAMSKWWLQKTPDLRSNAIVHTEPPGIGVYAAQSWEIFALRRDPSSFVVDEELQLYLRSDRWTLAP